MIQYIHAPSFPTSPLPSIVQRKSLIRRVDFEMRKYILAHNWIHNVGWFVVWFLPEFPLFASTERNEILKCNLHVNSINFPKTEKCETTTRPIFYLHHHLHPHSLSLHYVHQHQHQPTKYLIPTLVSVGILLIPCISINDTERGVEYTGARCLPSQPRPREPLIQWKKTNPARNAN